VGPRSLFLTAAPARIEAWLIDLRPFRTALMRQVKNGAMIRSGNRLNGDGTGFKWLDIGGLSGRAEAETCRGARTIRAHSGAPDGNLLA